MGKSKAKPAPKEEVPPTPPPPAEAPPAAVAKKEEKPAGEAAQSQDAILAQKIKELEIKASNTGGIDLENDPEWAKLTKLRRKQAKEIKQQWDAAEDANAKAELFHNRALSQLKELGTLERDLLVARKRNDILTRQRDAFQGEAQRSNLMKEKLHTLCSELQKQNKEVMAESKAVAKEEHDRRQELVEKFNTNIQDIAVKMEEQGEERMKQFKENDELKEKLRYLAEQYEVRDQHFAQQLKTKDLEGQLLEAKLAQQTEIAAHETAKADAYKKEALEMAAAQAPLQAQVSAYGDKFEAFQDTLNKSNEVLTTFKTEMDRLNKLIRTQEKEKKVLLKTVAELQGKTSKSDVTLIELVEERDRLRAAVGGAGAGAGGATEDVQRLQAQKEKLEALCRALTQQVKDLKAGAGGGGGGAVAAAA